MKFTQTPEELYQIKVPNTYKNYLRKKKESKLETSNIVQTVDENKNGYNKSQVEGAKAARMIYHIVGSPTVKAFKAVLKGNVIKICPVTTADVDIAEKIYGLAISTLKRKTTRKTTKTVVADEVLIPQELLTKLRPPELCMDTMFVNKQPF